MTANRTHLRLRALRSAHTEGEAMPTTGEPTDYGTWQQTGSGIWTQINPDPRWDWHLDHLPRQIPVTAPAPDPVHMIDRLLARTVTGTVKRVWGLPAPVFAAAVTLVTAVAVTLVILLFPHSGPSAQCRAAIRASNAYVSLIESEGPLNLTEEAMAISGATAHARTVLNDCGPTARIRVLHFS